jgi:hypothetical protein
LNEDVCLEDDQLAERELFEGDLDAFEERNDATGSVNSCFLFWDIDD